jgi:hypothetical protein
MSLINALISSSFNFSQNNFFFTACKESGLVFTADIATTSLFFKPYNS